MNHPDEWHAPPEPGPRKSKWIAGLLAAFFPGTGHMYLGLMTKGVFFMLLLAFNICAIVYFGLDNEYDNRVLIIVLLSLMVPILYFYNLFSVLQNTERVNARRAGGYLPPQPPDWNGHAAPPKSEDSQLPAIGIVVLLVGGFVLLQSSHSDWGRKLPHSFGAMTGAVILIGIGALLWLWERRGQSGRKD